MAELIFQITFCPQSYSAKALFKSVIYFQLKAPLCQQNTAHS
jgi:hypothetical protein